MAGFGAICKRRCSAHDGNGRQCPEFINRTDANANNRFCTKYHKCRLDSCPNLRIFGDGENRDFKYCSAHKCEDNSCSRLKFSSSQQSRWCKAHTCKDEFCSARVAASSSGCAGYCSMHATCKKLDCYNPLFTRPGESSPGLYCAAHCCRWQRCTNARAEIPGRGRKSLNVGVGLGDGGPAFCDAHLCRKVDCKNPRAGRWLEPSAGVCGVVAAEFCDQHECERKNCHSLKAKGLNWCHDHGCLEKGCQREVWEPSKWCKRHARCEEPGCSRRVLAGDGKPEAFCDIHYNVLSNSTSTESLGSESPSDVHPILCLFPGCTRPRPPIHPTTTNPAASGYFCSLHQCNSSTNCTNASVNTLRALTLASVLQHKGPQCEGGATDTTTCQRPRCYRPVCGKSINGHRGYCGRMACRNPAPLDYRILLDLLARRDAILAAAGPTSAVGAAAAKCHLHASTTGTPAKISMDPAARRREEIGGKGGAGLRIGGPAVVVIGPVADGGTGSGTAGVALGKANVGDYSMGEEQGGVGGRPVVYACAIQGCANEGAINVAVVVGGRSGWATKNEAGGDKEGNKNMVIIVCKAHEQRICQVGRLEFHGPGGELMVLTAAASDAWVGAGVDVGGRLVSLAPGLAVKCEGGALLGGESGRPQVVFASPPTTGVEASGGNGWAAGGGIGGGAAKKPWLDHYKGSLGVNAGTDWWNWC